MLNFQIRHCENFQCSFSKISLHYRTVIDQRLTVFHQLFSWTSVGPSKCPIDKMIGSQGHLTIWRVPWVLCVQDKNSITENFFQMNNFSNCRLSKIRLHSPTAPWSEASNLSRNVQLDFSWTHEMSDRRNDWFARGSDSLSNSRNTMCTSWELPHRKFLQVNKF